VRAQEPAEAHVGVRQFHLRLGLRLESLDRGVQVGDRFVEAALAELLVGARVQRGSFEVGGAGGLGDPDRLVDQPGARLAIVFNVFEVQQDPHQIAIELQGCERLASRCEQRPRPGAVTEHQQDVAEHAGGAGQSGRVTETFVQRARGTRLGFGHPVQRLRIRRGRKAEARGRLRRPIVVGHRAGRGACEAVQSLHPVGAKGFRVAQQIRQGDRRRLAVRSVRWRGRLSGRLPRSSDEQERSDQQNERCAQHQGLSPARSAVRERPDSGAGLRLARTRSAAEFRQRGNRRLASGVSFESDR
jgi:hypothetical protein